MASFGVEYGTATTKGGDYEIEACDSLDAARGRLAELRAEGYAPGDGVAVGARYASLVELDATGCPCRTLE